MARKSRPCNENMRLRWFETELKDCNFQKWLEDVAFSDEEHFNEKAFEASELLYQFKLQKSLLEDAVHNGIPSANFTEAQLNSAILEACKKVEGTKDTWWFHVNVHDGLVRVVERFGRYNYEYPLMPIYILLNHHQAVEGGTTYAGLISPHRAWMLLFDSGTSISVHGSQEFVRDVKNRLKPNPTFKRDS